MSALARDARGGLGRGLSALIPARGREESSVDQVPVELISPNPYQPREQIAEGALEELAGSIREHGVLQPLLVSRTLDGYQLIAGERRLRAARLAGLERVPVLVREAAPRDQLELALVENLQRADLNALEEARAYRQLADEFELSHEEIAQRVGRARPSVANAVRLLDLAAPVQEALAGGTISAGHARAMAGLESASLQEELLSFVLSRSLSVRQTEDLARRLKESGGPKIRRVNLEADPDLERVETELRTALGTKVKLAPKGGGGRITIEYYSAEDLSRISERLLGHGT